jgi:hypothetical protein
VVGEPVRLGLADQMNEAESDALNQLRERLRVDGYRDPDQDCACIRIVSASPSPSASKESNAC